MTEKGRQQGKSAPRVAAVAISIKKRANGKRVPQVVELWSTTCRARGDADATDELLERVLNVHQPGAGR
ncbi:hypothetical protein A9K66_24840 [Mesorhizobium sp. AA23]|nr:hypothetical protein A9K66_24840 [Mesorhizobium sp. AA23]